MQGSWHVRRYAPEDDQKIDSLFRRTFTSYGGLDRWAWIHKHNPLGFHGGEGDIWVAEADDGSVVGYYGRVRYEAFCFGKTIVASQGLNLATDPSYRRLGVAKTLADSSMADARRNGIKLGFGFPNGRSYPLAMKEGAIDAGPCGELHFVIDDARYFEPVGGGTLRSLAGRARRIAWGARHQTSAVVRLPGASELVGGFAEDADTLGVAVQDSFDIGLKRTGRYLAWRYNAAWGDYHVTSLVQQGACRGYTVTKSDLGAGGKVTRILEFVARDDSPEAYDSLISVAAREARDAGSYYISVSSALSPGAIQRLRHFGFVRIGSKARCVLYAYDDEVGRGLGGARFYQSLGDRDYL